jgi:hypothetical protein
VYKHIPLELEIHISIIMTAMKAIKQASYTRRDSVDHVDLKFDALTGDNSSNNVDVTA